MKCSSITEWKPGDKAITRNGEVVTVETVGSRMVKVVENIESKWYIPAHGEIEKL